MPRPALLVVDPDSSRRRELARGLSNFGYEVVPAVDADEGRRFADGLGPAVVVAAIDLPGLDHSTGGAGENHWASWTGGTNGETRRLLLLGHSAADAQELPENILFLVAADLEGDELVRRVRLVLLGSEIGIEPDLELSALLGDLALFPFLELMRALHRAGMSGQVRLAGGEVTLEHGEVVAAVAGDARGKKAFLRLTRQEDGPFRVVPASPGSELAASAIEMHQDLTSLLIVAIEDLVHDAPAPEARVHLVTGPGYFDTPFTPGQRQVLAALADEPTVAELLDSLAATDGEILRDLMALAGHGLIVFAEPQRPIAVVTDSAADLPGELARANGITVVPIHVVFGEQGFHDGVELSTREFYERLEKGGPPPRTQPPTAAELTAAYRGLAGRGELLSLHVSAKLSQTLANARLAADALQDPAGSSGTEVGHTAPTVLDSASVSVGLGLLALFAARLGRRGMPAAEIVQHLEGLRGRHQILFVVDTLEFLARGGRIGKARALVGNLLGLRPILGLLDGEVAKVEQVRGGRAAQARLVELLCQQVPAGRPVIIGIGHAKAPVWADRLRAALEGRLDVREVLVAEMGPVLGTHAGPGTVGAAIFQPTDEELPWIAPFAPFEG